MVLVEIADDLVEILLHGNSRVHLLGQVQDEAITDQFNRVDLERRLAAEPDPLQALTRNAPRPIPLSDPSDDQVSIGQESQTANAGLDCRPSDERKARPLIFALDLLHRDSDQTPLRDVADEHLAGERAELSACRVTHGSSG